MPVTMEELAELRTRLHDVDEESASDAVSGSPRPSWALPNGRGTLAG